MRCVNKLLYPFRSIIDTSQAFAWSISQNVDIIASSMSLDRSVEDGSEYEDEEVAYQNILQIARDVGITVFSPIGDSINNLAWGGLKSYMFRIAASKWDGSIRQPAPTQADFTLSVVGVKTPDWMSGDSTATAIAAGLAALMMASIANRQSTDSRILTLSSDKLNRIFASFCLANSKDISIERFMRILEKLEERLKEMW